MVDDPDQLFEETVGATQELEQLIGKPVRYFAFPFGQPENIHPEVFRLGRQHGWQGICSAYGGWNEVGEDAFHLRRFHGDPRMAYLKNWLTLDPRKRRMDGSLRLSPKWHPPPRSTGRRVGKQSLIFPRSICRPRPRCLRLITKVAWIQGWLGFK